ncbi:MAG: hypothetical protein ACAH59_12160 [Pseudobdellovibrionaceae bacterium]
MGKRIYLVLMAALVLLGLGAMIYFGIQPRPIQKIKISQFENHTVLGNSILLRLREEIKLNPLLFLGVEPENPEHQQIWKEFLRLNQEPGLRYDVIAIEQFLGTQEFPEASPIETTEKFTQFMEGTRGALQAGKRVVVIVPTLAASQAVFGNLVNTYKKKTSETPMSLSLSELPRTREMEKDMRHKCVVEGVDQTGEGALGCYIAQAARSNYRKKFETGQHIGLVMQVGLKDFLVLYTQEK